jgi:hypothetical protein
MQNPKKIISGISSLASCKNSSSLLSHFKALLEVCPGLVKSAPNSTCSLKVTLENNKTSLSLKVKDKQAETNIEVEAEVEKVVEVDEVDPPTNTDKNPQE